MQTGYLYIRYSCALVLAVMSLFSGIPGLTTPTSTKTPIATPTSDPFSKQTNNAAWINSIRVASFGGMELVLVPAGCFMMGSTDEQLQTEVGYLVNRGVPEAKATVILSDETPIHRVCFERPFWIGRYEVTNAQYGSEGFFEGANKPRDNVSWTDADTFCRQHDTRLPTEAEWEYAARGPDDLVYPWGNTFIADNLVYSMSLEAPVADVGSKPKGISWVGAYDLSGNLFEWVADWDGLYSADEQINPQGAQ